MDYILHEDYLKIKDDPINLFSAIYTIKDEEKIKQLIIDINNKDNIDICKYAVNVIENGHDTWYVCSFLEDVIDDLNLNKESLFEYFRIINQKLQEKIGNTTRYSEIQNITVNQPVFAEEFLEYLMLSDEPFVFNYIVEIILNLNKIDIAEKHLRLLLMANSDIENKSICGISGLGRIQYQSEDNQELLNKTLLCFDSLIKQEQHLINGAITKSLGQMYSQGDQVISRLINLSKRNDSCILMEIVIFLFLRYKYIKKEHFYEILLFSLTKVNSNYLGIIKELDMLLHSIVTDSNCQIIIIVSFLIKWMSDSDCKPNKIASLNLLPITFNGIYNNTNVLQEISLLLFNNDNLFAPQLAAYIITSNKFPREIKTYINPNSLSDFDDTDIIYICRKILGHFIQPDIMISLFYSILMGKNGNSKIVELICNYFHEYISHNYPETTIKIITELLKSEKANITCENILQKILKDTKQIKKDRVERTFLKELAPSRKELYLLHKEEWQNSQKYIEAAERISVMNLLATKSYIKYGKSASYYINGQITETAPFKEFSYSMERTFNIIVDPVGFDMDRFYFQNVQRGEN
jgi:hypothetical protein